MKEESLTFDKRAAPQPGNRSPGKAPGEERLHARSQHFIAFISNHMLLAAALARRSACQHNFAHQHRFKALQGPRVAFLAQRPLHLSHCSQCSRGREGRARAGGSQISRAPAPPNISSRGDDEGGGKRALWAGKSSRHPREGSMSAAEPTPAFCRCLVDVCWPCRQLLPLSKHCHHHSMQSTGCGAPSQTGTACVEHAPAA